MCRVNNTAVQFQLRYNNLLYYNYYNFPLFYASGEFRDGICFLNIVLAIFKGLVYKFSNAK